MANKHADLYMGIGQAMQELHRIQQHLMAFGLTDEQRLEGVEDAIKFVGQYLIDTEKMYKFDELCTSREKHPQADDLPTPPRD